MEHVYIRLHLLENVLYCRDALFFLLQQTLQNRLFEQKIFNNIGYFQRLNVFSYVVGLAVFFQSN